MDIWKLEFYANKSISKRQSRWWLLFTMQWDGEYTTQFSSTQSIPNIPRFSHNSNSGFVCVMFYKRNAHVAELQMGTPATRLEDACATDHFDTARLPFITLLGNWFHYSPVPTFCFVESFK